MSGINEHEQLVLSNTEAFKKLLVDCKRLINVVRDMEKQNTTPEDMNYLSIYYIYGQSGYVSFVRDIVMEYFIETGERDRNVC